MSPLSVPKIFMAGGAVGFGYYLYMRQYWFPNPYKTQGVQNIEDRFSSGGGHPTHAPAQASMRGTASETRREPLPLQQLLTRVRRHSIRQRGQERGRQQQGPRLGALQEQPLIPAERGEHSTDPQMTQLLIPCSLSGRASSTSCSTTTPRANKQLASSNERAKSHVSRHKHHEAREAI